MEKKEGAVHFAVVLGMLAMPRQEVVSEPGVIVIEDLPRASWACMVRARLVALRMPRSAIPTPATQHLSAAQPRLQVNKLFKNIFTSHW